MIKKIWSLTLVFGFVFVLGACQTISTTTTSSVSTSFTTSTTTMSEIEVTNLENNEGFVTWTIQDGVRYDVYINGSLTAQNVTSFHFNTLSQEMIYKLEVYASRDEEVSVSRPLFYNSISTALPLENMYIDLANVPDTIALRVEDTLLYIVEYTSYDEVTFSEAEGIYYIDRSYVMTLTYGIQYYYLVFEDHVMNFSLTVYDSRKPEIATSNEQEVALGEDAVFSFHLYGGSFVSLSGNDITESDYIFDGETLTVDGTYIENKFVLEPGRTTLILGYTLEKEDQIVIGYLFITITSEE